jgi:hypothetical protein
MVKIPVKLIKVQSLDVSLTPIKDVSKIEEQNDGPKPTREQVADFKQNRSNVIEEYLYPQLRRTGDIFHGAQSRNKIISDDIGEEEAKRLGLIKRTYDYDVYSRSPKSHARAIENAIDKRYNADMAYIEKKAMGKAQPSFLTTNLTPFSKRKHDRWVVVTRATPSYQDAEVDYTTLPDRKVHTIKKKGIKHEKIESALERHNELVNVPMRAHKTWEDIKRLKKYLEYMEE